MTLKSWNGQTHANISATGKVGFQTDVAAFDDASYIVVWPNWLIAAHLAFKVHIENISKAAFRKTGWLTAIWDKVTLVRYLN